MKTNPHKQFLLELADLMDEHGALLSTGGVSNNGYTITVDVDDKEIDIEPDYIIDCITSTKIRKTANEL